MATTMRITQLETITALDGIHGGVQSGNAPEQKRERHRNLCELPNPTEAERQYREMASWGDRGVWRRTVEAIGKECGWTPPPRQ